MEIIQERLEREYNLDLITTAPSVIFRITKSDGTVEYIDNPTNYPDPSQIAKAEEPVTEEAALAEEKLDVTGPAPIAEEKIVPFLL